MANVCVSATCNLTCAYCFAASSMAAATPGERFLSLDEFEHRLDFLEQSGIREARLIGGEPTLHPQFPELVERALRRLDRVLVFTNGCIPSRSLDALLAVGPDRCTALVNMTEYHGDGLPASVRKRRERSLFSLGTRALVGITLVRPVVDYDWLPRLVSDAGCRPAMRIGLGHPTLTGSNRFLHPKQYPQVGTGLVRLGSVASADGVRLELDCGFVRCMFSDDDLAQLSDLDADVGWHCSPVCDIDLDGRMTHCFPLAAMQGVKASSAMDATSVRELLAQQVAPYRGVGIYRECSSCRFHASGVCSGGCRGAAMSRFHRNEFRVAPPTNLSTSQSFKFPVPSTGGIR